MKKILILLISLITPVFLVSPALADSHNTGSRFFIRNYGSHLTGSTSSSSENWSGYAALGNNGAFNTVNSTWTQPSLNCPAVPENSYSAYWVGLDGFNDQTVE